MSARQRQPIGLPLSWRPGGVALLDDDPAFLQIAAAPLASHWSTALFEDADDFVAALLRELPFREADAWEQQEVVRSWRAGKASLAAEVLRYWTRNTERYAFTRVAIVDFALEAGTGIDALRKLRDWEGHAVLLTGVADHKAAIAAFNERLIDRYERKSDGPLVPRIPNLVAELQDAPDLRLDQIWRSTLTESQERLLRSPDVARPLMSFLRQQVAEYVVMGDPFGVMGLTAGGQVAWLPLRLGTSLANEWVDDESLRTALGLSGIPKREPALRFGFSQPVFGALFAIDEISDAQPSGYRQWLDQRGLAYTGSYMSRG